VNPTDDAGRRLADSIEEHTPDVAGAALDGADSPGQSPLSDVDPGGDERPEWYRRRLHEVMTADVPLDGRIDAVLELGRQYLGVEAAFVSDIDTEAGEFTVTESTQEVGEPLAEGAEYDLSQTYCRRTLEGDGPLALHDTPEAPGWEDDPAYEEHGLDCYLGATVTVNEKPHGTVCFVSTASRELSFSEAERTFAELVARLIGQAIEREQFEASIEAREQEVAARERALEASEAKYETLLSTSPDAVFVLDPETGAVLDANEAAADLTGYDAGSLPGKSVTAFFPSGERDRYGAAFERLVEEGGTHGRFPDGDRLYVATADGEQVPVEVNAATVDLGDDEVLQASVRDVSDRLERTRELNERDERFRSLVEATFDVAFQLDLRGTITDVSAAVEETLGYDPDALVGEHFAQLMPEEGDVSASVAAFERVLEGETVEEPYVRLSTADGEVRYMDFRIAPVFRREETDGDDDGDDEVVGVQGVVRDVTDRYEREQDLRVRTRAVEAAAVGTVITDATAGGNPIVYANEKFEEMTGYDESEIRGRNCRFLQGPGTDQEATARLREAIEGGESATVELKNYRRDGTPFWNEVTIAPVTDGEGDLTHFVGFQRDVTERVRRERHLEVLNRVLRHNLRNGMNVVKGFTSILGTELADRGEPDLVDRAERIQATADTLLAVSETARNLEAAVEDDGSQVTDVVTAVETVRDRLEEAYPDASVRLETPASARALAPERLEAALWELADNAARHARTGEPTVEVTVRDHEDGVAIAVADEGPGLPDQERTVLSEGRETSLEHGSGLGLWLVHTVVAAADGTVAVDTDEDGTRIRVDLRPAAEAGTQ
jgi:PAS domain S-box-containing protein